MRVIAIDLDNVISDTDAKIREIIRKKYGLNPRRKDIIEFDYENCLPITNKQAEEVLREFHSHHVLTLRLTRGAKSALELIALSFKVIIATERPLETREATIKWLRVRNIPSASEEIIFVKDKEELLAIHISWLVDDKWENAIKLANKGIPVILFDRPWNRKGTHSLIQRAHGWRGVLHCLGVDTVSNNSIASFIYCCKTRSRR